MTKSANHVLAAPGSLQLPCGTELTVIPLTRKRASQERETIRALTQLIPYVGETYDVLEPDRAKNPKFPEKWRLSVAALVGDQLVAVLVAYLRESSQTHPMMSVYLHRLAVFGQYQRKGIGSALVAYAATTYFRHIPWLLSVSVQTNDEPGNQHVLRMYERLGFRRCKRVRYPNKTDWLLDLSRATLPPQSHYTHKSDPSGADERARVVHPIARRSLDGPPEVYFATSSREKREQYRLLFRFLGLHLRELQTVVQLTEPQLESAGPSAESELVTGPLKLYSRFAARARTYPMVVEDTMLFIEHFNNEYDTNSLLPGPDTKRWWKSLGSEGLLRVLGGSLQRRCKYVCQLGVAIAEREYVYFRHELHGTIATATQVTERALVSFPYTNPTFFHSVFIPDGADRVLAAMEAEEFLRYDYRWACLKKAQDSLYRTSTGLAQLSLFWQ